MFYNKNQVEWKKVKNEFQYIWLQIMNFNVQFPRPSRHDKTRFATKRSFFQGFTQPKKKRRKIRKKTFYKMWEQVRIFEKREKCWGTHCVHTLPRTNSFDTKRIMFQRFMQLKHTDKVHFTKTSKHP